MIAECLVIDTQGRTEKQIHLPRAQDGGEFVQRFRGFDYRRGVKLANAFRQQKAVKHFHCRERPAATARSEPFRFEMLKERRNIDRPDSRRIHAPSAGKETEIPAHIAAVGFQCIRSQPLLHQQVIEKQVQVMVHAKPLFVNRLQEPFPGLGELLLTVHFVPENVFHIKDVGNLIDLGGDL